MAENDLAINFADCFDKSSTSIVGTLSEFTLDTFLKDGGLKDFPIFSTISSVYRVGKSISEFAYLKKLVSFINAINAGTADEQKRSDYAYKLRTNEKFRNNELEHILTLLDRYIGTEKPEMLAKLYLAYLDEKICWIEFTMHAEVIDRFLPGDYKMLQNNYEIKSFRNIGSEPLLRLMALGLVAEKANNLPFEELGDGHIGVTISSMGQMRRQEKVFQRTAFGEQLVSILSEM